MNIAIFKVYMQGCNTINLFKLSFILVGTYRCCCGLTKIFTGFKI